jgi:hypothetical protein
MKSKSIFTEIPYLFAYLVVALLATYIFNTFTPSLSAFLHNAFNLEIIVGILWLYLAAFKQDTFFKSASNKTNVLLFVFVLALIAIEFIIINPYFKNQVYFIQEIATFVCMMVTLYVVQFVFTRYKK